MTTTPPPPEPPNPSVKESDVELAVRAAEAAAAIHRAYADQELQIETKSAAIDLVTQADTEAEDVIRAILLADRPDDAILGEERGGPKGHSSRRWLVDPLDGTLNYAHRFPWYCVSIALEIEGRLELGVVLDPCRDALYTAQRGQGAYRNGQALRVTDRTELGESMLATGFAYRAGKMAENVAIFAAMMPKVRAIRRPGAAALDLAHLAAGSLDGFWELYLNPWDTAAGIVLIEEAGGRVSGPEGEPYRLEGDFIVASNGRIHEALLTALSETGKSQ